MSDRRVSYRPAKATDVVKFTRYACPADFAGIVGEVDGEVAGLGIIVRGVENKFWLCLEVTEKGRGLAFPLHRMARRLIKAWSGELYSLQSTIEAKSEKWLRVLGFEPTGRVLNSEGLIWRRSCP